MGFVLNAAPLGQRVLYVSFVNTMLGITSLPMMAGDLLAERLGLESVFLVSALLVLLSAGLAFALREPRPTRAPDGPAPLPV